MRIARTKPRVMRARRPVAPRSSQVNTLYELALQAAQASGDSRVAQLQAAKPHQRDRVLRSMSILSATDVEREFG